MRTAAAEGFDKLYEADHSAQEVLKRVARSLEPLAGSIPELADATATLERLAEETREVAYTLRDLGANWEDDPRRLEDIEARLALYRRLSSRFHCGADELAGRWAETEAKLAALVRDDTELRGLDAPLAEAWKTVKSSAEALSAARRKTAKDFGRSIQSRLKPLGLEASRLTVEVESRDLGDDPTGPAPPESGADRVEMLFLANPGEAPRPLRKIASGGELSRVTLAAKTVLAGVDRVPTLIFDEIDTGVGGRLGAALGKTLAELGRHHQVVCVTHLPQLASYARRQWVIRKQTDRGRTRTTISPLEEADRVYGAGPHAPGRFRRGRNPPGSPGHAARSPGHRQAQPHGQRPCQEPVIDARKTTPIRSRGARETHSDIASVEHGGRAWAWRPKEPADTSLMSHVTPSPRRLTRMLQTEPTTEASPVGRPGPEPGASLFVWLVWGMLLVVALIYVARFGPDVPLWDDYAVIPQLAGAQPVTPQWLWSQHSEHRIPLARLILLGTFHLTGADPRGVMFLIVGLLAAVAGLLILAARKAFGGSGYADAFLPILF